MKIESTGLKDVMLVSRDMYHDIRGFFLETNRETDFPVKFVQDNVSCSHAGVLRGLHYQLHFPQAKLVSVLHGAIFDVAVDIRKGSATFGRWVGFTLRWRAGEQLFIPAGFAHGFYAMEENTVVHYKCSDVYRPNDARTIIWNDPDLGIDWPLRKQPVLSDADKAAVPLKFSELPEYNQ